MRWFLLLCISFTLGLSKDRVLYINSYHESYSPAIIQMTAVKDILEPLGIKLKFVHMDTKHIRDNIKRKEEAIKVKHTIENWKPDLVIASDDAASKYVVKEYYKDDKLPFVFIGVNWSVEQYGYPYKNVTGQIEVALAKELVKELQSYAKGKRVGYISGKTSTDKKALKNYQEKLGLKFDIIYMAKDFEEWKTSYKSLQHKVDMFIFRSNSGINGWNDKEARIFIEEETKIPSGSVNIDMSHFVVINFAKDNYEFGEYGAKTALKVLKGTPIEQIPITKNKKARVSLNMTLAKKQGILFPIELINMATLVK